ncbi:MAG: zf-HC2 domain-containing protein, partial [Planctomycetes bacterium]|nr:zf-HC2 domain-containing protein [Planctomycetota bacterium]
MNCKSVQKFLHAFADGQLGVRANCEVLDHLKMCPSC